LVAFFFAGLRFATLRLAGFFLAGLRLTTFRLAGLRLAAGLFFAGINVPSAFSKRNFH
jgi:hypothetical protein